MTTDLIVKVFLLSWYYSIYLRREFNIVSQLQQYRNSIENRKVGLRRFFPVFGSVSVLLYHQICKLYQRKPFVQDPKSPERRHRSYKNKVQERTKIFNEMKRLQLGKLNRATYNLLLDVSPMVDQESNVLQHFLSSDLVSLGIQENSQ